jgi:hypothetical protein
MERYIINTNVVSDYFSSSLSSTGIKFMDKVINAIPNLSVMTQIELLCWKTGEDTEQKIKEFIADSEVLEINPEVITQCVKIREGKMTKIPDAIIAATALAYGYKLITSNEKDFANIKGLKLINPMRL